jgi:hypothetical protein
MAHFSELEWRPHPAGVGGRQGLASFDNGYSVSVVQFNGSYGYEQGLWELAVKHGGRLCYDTPVTDDVLGYLTEEDVTRHMGEVAALPARESASA